MQLLFNRIAIIILIMLCLAADSSAAEITVTASVDRNQVTIEDQVMLTVSVVGSRSSSAPELPDLPDFDVQSKGSSSRVQIINGSIASQVDYIFLLMPRRPGLFTIGPVTVRYKRKSYRTEPITIRVARAAQADGVSRDLFITTEVDDPSPYVGQQVLYSLKFFRRVRVSNAALGELKFEGFQTEDLGEEDTYASVKNGIRYQVTEIRRLLYPIRPGEVTLPEAALKCQIPVDRNSGANPFFGMGRTKTKVLRSDPIQMNVRPLPMEGKPGNFSGLVGVFSLSAQLGKSEVEQGESVTLTIRVTGEGDLSGAPRPDISGIDQFKIYDDQPTMSRKLKAGRVISEKIFKAALVPLKDGRQMLPDVSLRFFNPQTNVYEKASAGPFTLNVLPSAIKEDVQVVGPGPRPTSKKRVEAIGRDILPIATDLRDFGDEVFSPVSTVPLLMFFLPPFLFAGVFLFKRERDKLTGDMSYARRKAALKQAKKRIKEARRLGRRAEPKLFYAQLSKTLQAYLGAKINLAGEARTPSELKEALGDTLREQSLLDEVHSKLRELEFMQFAPDRQDSDQGEALIKQVETLITKLERVL